MPENIRLEVPSTRSGLATVRMVLGGLCARLDFGLESIDDVTLATNELLAAALTAEHPISLSVEMAAEDATLRVVTGPFDSERLRSQVTVTPGGCIDLCMLLQRLVDETVVQEEEGGFRVVLVKSRSGAAS